MSAIPFPLVWIEWNDAASIDAWTDAQEMDHGLRACVTVGWLMRETAGELYVSATRSDSEACCTTIIPKRCITFRRPIHTAPPARGSDLA